jgi:predicted Holliday junction resolvase-like endonuclease
MTSKLIRQLVSISGLKIECPNPNCGVPFPIGRAKLFSMYDLYPPAVKKIIRLRLQKADQLQADIRERTKALAANRKQKPRKIAVSAHASNFGQISEQILPAFLTFPYKRNECRVLLKPIDYLVFVNLSNKGRVDTIKFVDVKTGNGQLDSRQRKIRDRIGEGKICHNVIVAKS